MRTLRLIAAGLFVFGLANLCRAQEPVNLTVNADKVVQQIDDRIYGQFLEHIYHSLHGGLWGEVVWNRSFEEGLPRPRGPRAGGGAGGGGGGGAGATAQPSPAPVEPPPGGTYARHWFIAGGATVTVATNQALNSDKSVKIVAEGAGAGVAQKNFSLRKGDTLRGSLWMRGEAPDGILVRLVDGNTVVAEQTLSAPGTDWREYPLTLTPSAPAENATLQIVARGKAALWLDQVSLMPDSFRATGGFRSDLLQAVMDLHPATIRWPGGSYVGNNGGYNWKGGIGPQSKRIGKIGWDELDPSAFGIDEFIALCRKVGAEPVVVVYMGAREPGADRSKQVQDACDWVEYCNGPSTAKWGAVRAANGHSEPYRVKYWEIDNEVWRTPAQEYVKILQAFVPAMKKVDRGIVAIGCGSGGFGGRWADGDVAVIEQCADLVDFLSIHHYENATRFAEGPARAEEYFRKLGELIAKSKNPAKFKIYMSEWNAQTTDWRTGLYAGGILNVFERDKYVTMACPALFLRHASAPAWDNAFINFDHRTWFPAPNYVVMKLYRDHFAPNLLEVTGDTAGLSVIATKSADGKRVVLKVVNAADKAVAVKAAVKGAFAPSKAGFQLVAPDDLSARNTFEKRDLVRTVDAKVERAGNKVSFSMPRWAVGVVELSN